MINKIYFVGVVQNRNLRRPQSHHSIRQLHLEEMEGIQRDLKWYLRKKKKN